MAAKTKREMRSSNPLKDFNAVVVVGPGSSNKVSMVKSASWSDFGVCATSAGAAAGEKKVAVAEAGAAAGGEKVAAAGDKKVAAVEAGVAAGDKKVVAAEAGAAAGRRFHYSVPSDEHFNLWEDATDREELRVCFTEFAALVDQCNAELMLEV
ncbi:unnamed protein product [Miscanthus lutarioriparius]|uniref:Uncharacterized protein n=1 Tax=Miscanthus lutarioriparius TaxID=422564 RepID=A0A811RXW4_9POAL|nr:unnamed protein product [Miscanthus lutarioriparius]